MPKPVLSDSLFNADDVATAVIAEANLQTLDLNLGVTDITSEFTLGTGWSYNTNNFDYAIKAYTFNGFVFIMGAVGRGDTSQMTAFTVTTNYRPTVEAYMPTISYQGDSGWALRVMTNGNIDVIQPNNVSSGSFYITFNGFYRIS